MERPGTESSCRRHASARPACKGASRNGEQLRYDGAGCCVCQKPANVEGLIIDEGQPSDSNLIDWSLSVNIFHVSIILFVHVLVLFLVLLFVGFID